MNYKFPIPKRIISSILLAAVSAVLIFAVLALAVQLTGGREMEDFTDTDRVIFWGQIAVELVLLIAYIAFLADSGYLCTMRRRLIRKYREHFSDGGNSLVYQPYDAGGVWMDERNGKRAISYCEKKPHLVLIEQYDKVGEKWAAAAMRVYDSTAEIEQSLRNDYGFEIISSLQAEKTIQPTGIHAKPSISISIEDSDV